MRLQRITTYLLKHRGQALALTFLSTFIPVVGVIGILIAALMTLLKGVLEGAIFTLAATLPYLISFLITGGHEAALPLFAWAAVGVAILSNILTWAFAVMLRRQMSWSMIIQIAALVGVLLISIVHLVYPNVMDWWGVQLQTYYQHAQAALNGNATTPATESQADAINATKQYATGLMTTAVLLNALFQLIVARWWQAIVFSPGSLRRELYRIRLSRLAGGLFVLSLVLSYLGNIVVLDIMPVLYVLFGAAGLSLMHYFIGTMRSPTAWFWLLLMYVTLIFAMPVSLMAIALLALLDIWLDLRKRLTKI